MCINTVASNTMLQSHMQAHISSSSDTDADRWHAVLLMALTKSWTCSRLSRRLEAGRELGGLPRREPLAWRGDCAGSCREWQFTVLHTGMHPVLAAYSLLGTYSHH